MSQITHGIRAILTSPFVYSTFQKLMGAEQIRSWLTENVIKPQQGMNVLDIGCGPADILEQLGKVNYWGYDISEQYIQQAKQRFGHRGNFFCKLFTKEDLNTLPKMDIIIMVGVLHHLEDSEAHHLIQLLCMLLKDGGRLITLDACYINGQNKVARFLISKDRGQNVRNQEGYLALMQDGFSYVSSQIRHQTWIPYTHCLIEGKK